MLSALSTVISVAALPTMHWLDLSAAEMHFVILQKFSIGNFYNFYNLTARQTMKAALQCCRLQAAGGNTHMDKTLLVSLFNLLFKKLLECLTKHNVKSKPLFLKNWLVLVAAKHQWKLQDKQFVE